MPHYIVPERPFTLSDRSELIRPPKRAVPMQRLATAVITTAWTALLAVITASAVTLIQAVRWDDKPWQHWVAWMDPWMSTAALLPVAFFAWRWSRIEVAWHFSGYHLGDDELFVRSGLLFRDLTTLSYARIQVVEVSSGPIQRRFRLASVCVSVAGTTVSVDNLDPQTAADLRDKLNDLAKIERFPV